MPDYILRRKISYYSSPRWPAGFEISLSYVSPLGGGSSRIVSIYVHRYY